MQSSDKLDEAERFLGYSGPIGSSSRGAAAWCPLPETMRAFARCCSMAGSCRGHGCSARRRSGRWRPISYPPKRCRWIWAAFGCRYRGNRFAGNPEAFEDVL